MYLSSMLHSLSFALLLVEYICVSSLFVGLTCGYIALSGEEGEEDEVGHTSLSLASPEPNPNKRQRKLPAKVSQCVSVCILYLVTCVVENRGLPGSVYLYS